MDISKGKRPFQNKYVQGCRGSNLLFRASLCWKLGAARPAPHVVSVLPEKQLGACVRLIRTRSHVLSRGTEADTRRCAWGLGWTCPIPHVRRALRGSPTLRSGQGLALSDLPRTALVRVLLSHRDLTATGSSACLRHVQALSLLQSSGSQSGAPGHPWRQNTFCKRSTCPSLLVLTRDW